MSKNPSGSIRLSTNVNLHFQEMVIKRMMADNGGFTGIADYIRYAIFYEISEYERVNDKKLADSLAVLAGNPRLLEIYDKHRKMLKQRKR